MQMIQIGGFPFSSKISLFTLMKRNMSNALAAALLLGAFLGFAPQVLADGGLPLWTNYYDGPASGDEDAVSIGVDGSGNVFVTGRSPKLVSGFGNVMQCATLAYSNDGTPLWTNRFSATPTAPTLARGLGVGTNGNVYVTGTSLGNFVTVAYSNAGAPIWTNYYGGIVNGTATAIALAVANSGNVFVAGFSSGSFSGDYDIVAYSSVGLSLWTNHYNGPSNGQDSATAVVADGSGNAIVTGTSVGAGGYEDFATIKYSNAGLALWTNRYDSPVHLQDYPSAVAVDSSNNVFVTGYSANNPNSPVNFNYVTVKYSSAGVPLWTNRYNSTGNGDDYAKAIAVDSTGNVFITGYSLGGSGLDCATIKYSNDGVPQWTNHHVTLGYAIALDNNGSVFITGSQETIAYSGAGMPLWTNSYGGGNASAIAVDAAANVFVTGQWYNNTSFDYGTIKYSAFVIPNQPPIVANPIPDQAGTYGSVLSYSFPSSTFVDPDAGQTLSYTVSNLPPGIAFDGATRTFSGTNTGVGTNVVTVTATDNGSPPMSTNTSFSIAVGKAILTATALNRTNHYGDSIFLDSRCCDVDYSDFKFPTYSQFGLQTPPDISTTATSTSPVCVYPITLSGGADVHYVFDLHDGLLTIVPAPATVLVYDACRVVEQTNPPLEGRIDGLLNNDPITLTLSTAATPSCPPGSYPISLSLNDPSHRATNYNFSYLNGVLTVLQFGFRFDVVHTFGTSNELGTADVAKLPGAAVTEGADGFLYGLTMYGGALGHGATFAMHRDGTAYSVLSSLPSLVTLDNGFRVPAPLIFGNNGLLYNAAPGNGSFSPGSLFSVDTNGNGVSIIRTFSQSEGGPNGLLLSTNGLLYGTATGGSDIIYSIGHDGSGFTVLWQSSNFTEPRQFEAGLIEGSDGVLYGVSPNGGDLGGGTVFKIQKDGSGLTVLHNFGPSPWAQLIEASDGQLYATTVNGGSFNDGTVFRLAKDGSVFTLLHEFNSARLDGKSPLGAVGEGTDGVLYGTTVGGGAFATPLEGTVYRLNKDGTGYCVLHSFGGDQANPAYVTSSLIQASDGSFYGTSKFGGAFGYGTVFRLTPVIPPALSIQPATPGSVTLSWVPPTPGFVLQQNISLDPQTWINAPSGSTNPIILPIGTGQLFFRLYTP